MGSEESSISVNVVVPSVLRQFTEGQEQVKIVLNSDIMFNVKSCLDRLASLYPGIKQKLYDKEGEIPRFFHLFVNRKKVNIDQPLTDGDELIVMIAVSGG